MISQHASQRLWISSVKDWGIEFFTMPAEGILPARVSMTIYNPNGHSVMTLEAEEVTALKQYLDHFLKWQSVTSPT